MITNLIQQAGTINFSEETCQAETIVILSDDISTKMDYWTQNRFVNSSCFIIFHPFETF